MSNEIAMEIFRQIGGNRFVIMTGAKCYVENDMLSMTLPASMTKKRGNRFSIKLMPDDTYQCLYMKYKPSKLSADILECRNDVYCDNLEETFTDMTGLYTRF